MYYVRSNVLEEWIEQEWRVAGKIWREAVKKNVQKYHIFGAYQG